MRAWIAAISCGLAVLIATPGTWAQEFWAKQLGGGSASSVTLDDAGNVYTVGTFGGTADFDPGPGTYNMTSPGYGDTFISKLDSGGNLVWTRQLGGAGGGVEATQVSLDASGNVYTVGRFFNTADFDPGPGTFSLTSASDGRYDLFISKLDSGGNFVWARRLGGSGYDEAFGVSLDAAGNVYTVGDFMGTADFDPGPGTYNLTAGGQALFVSKLDSGGNFVLAEQVGGAALVLGSGVSLDAAGNVYTVGIFSGTADFDPGPGTFDLTSGSDYYSNAFILKLDSGGHFLWAKQLGGDIYTDIEAHGVSLDAAGNVYAVGVYQGSVDFDPGPGTFPLSSALHDGYVSKLDSGGNFIWARRLGGAGEDRTSRVNIDAAGSVYTVGYFTGTADFDPGPGTYNLTAAGGHDAYISKLDSGGNFLRADRVGGTGVYTSATGVSLDAHGDVLTVGTFTGTTDFDTGPGIYNMTPANGSQEAFLLNLVPGSGIVPDGADTPGTPLTVTRAAGNITLTWGGSCATGDNDYEIYQGTLVSPFTYDHAAMLCSTGGEPAMTFPEPAGSAYYLVVPRNTFIEGSYGRASSGIERPQGAPACLPQRIASPCP